MMNLENIKPGDIFYFNNSHNIWLFIGKGQKESCYAFMYYPNRQFSRLNYTEIELETIQSWIDAINNPLPHMDTIITVLKI